MGENQNCYDFLGTSSWSKPSSNEWISLVNPGGKPRTNPVLNPMHLNVGIRNVPFVLQFLLRNNIINLVSPLIIPGLQLSESLINITILYFSPEVLIPEYSEEEEELNTANMEHLLVDLHYVQCQALILQYPTRKKTWWWLGSFVAILSHADALSVEGASAKDPKRSQFSNKPIPARSIKKLHVHEKEDEDEETQLCHYYRKHQTWPERWESFKI